MHIHVQEFRDKVLACWLGKNIGGTLGAPFEWKRQLNNVSFYAQDLAGEPAPNDDLDVQLLWLIALEEMGIELDAHTLAEYWTLYLTPHWAEYGNAKINMRAGLVPPLSGTMFNEYKDSCGCFLRSEIWACIAPGNPRLAARDRVLEKYRGSMFFNMRSQITDEDWEKGFGSGKRGWDVPSNIGMIIIGLLYGDGDFGESVCTAVNCGEDTDCTGATLGALFGILHGLKGIPEKWIAPIGRKIKAACLNLGELGYYGNQLPADVDELTDRTIRITRQVIDRFNSPTRVEDAPTDLAGASANSLMAGGEMAELYANLNATVFHFDFFDVAVDYGEGGVVIRDNGPKTICLRIYNRYKIQANLSIHWYTPDTWIVLPSKDNYRMSFPSSLGEPIEIAYQITIPQVAAPMARAVIEITASGRSLVMLVPVMFLNGN
jgi:ADP-ribosylglycohydrolase